MTAQKPGLLIPSVLPAASSLPDRPGCTGEERQLGHRRAERAGERGGFASGRMREGTASRRRRRSALLRPLLADGAARARAAGVAHDLRGDGPMSRRRINWRRSTRASETASVSVWQPSFTLLKNSLDVRNALGSLGYIDAVLKLRKRYRLYPSWLVGWPIFDARLSGGRLWVKRVLLRPL